LKDCVYAWWRFLIKDMDMKKKLFLLCLIVLGLVIPGSLVASAQDKAIKSMLALPDLDAAYIARLPRYDYDAAKNQPISGDVVTFQANIANRGSQNTGTFSYGWYIDNTSVYSNTHPGLGPGETVTLSLGWTWQTGPHFIRIELDPNNLISEVSEQNNSIEDQTNALAVGFWVEQSVYDYFNVHQVELGLGSVSWDDWAQRQIHAWNQMFENAVSPLTPQGIIDRVRLDKVTVVPDGMLPACATNFPAPDDKTIDLQWGFPSEEVGIPSGHICGAFNYYIENPGSQNVEYSLMHELSHARYLIDLYGLNVFVNAAHLSADADSISSTLNLDRNVEEDSNFQVPAYLAIEGELVICQTKSGNTFLSCSRGADGTTSRSHASGALVNLATVRLQDGKGNLIQGSPAMPVIGWEDHLYYNRYPNDLMSGGQVYEQYSAYAWNRIAGRRPVCGNYNSPCNIGEYLRDIPEHNILEIHGENGQPLHLAKVELHQPHAYPAIYGKVFLKDPDAVYFTDAQGHVDLGESPFGDLSTDVGPHKGVILLKITSAGQSTYQFFEITLSNEAYWAGSQVSATYPISTTLQQGTPPMLVFLPVVLNDYSTIPRYTLTSISQASDGEVGNTNCNSWDQCRNAAQGNLAYSTFEGATVASRYEAGKYDVKRVFFTFDTSAVPVNATIVSARLNFYAGPYQNGSTRRVHVVDSFQGVPLTSSDFNHIGFISGGFADLVSDTWKQIPLNPTGLTWIVKGGVTKFALIHDLDLNNVTPSDGNDSIISMSEASGYQPTLVLQYTLP
jgi:hypothetical protein